MLLIEKRTIDSNEISEGVISERFLFPVTFGLFLLLMISSFSSNLWNGYLAPIFITILALLISRLAAFDLRYCILPNIYVLPILASGLIVPHFLGINTWQQSLIGAAIGLGIPLVITFASHKLRGDTLGIGGGDIKLLSASCAWVGAEQLSIIVFIACLSSLIFFLPLPKSRHIPFGPGICLGFWLILLYENEIYDLIYRLIDTIN